MEQVRLTMVHFTLAICWAMGFSYYFRLDSYYLDIFKSTFLSPWISIVVEDNAAHILKLW